MSDVPGAEDPPLAAVRPSRWLRRWFSEEPVLYWILAIVALSAALGLSVWAWRSAGPTIVVRFQDGHGLKAGDQLRHRGIDVGEVKSVRLDESLQGVVVEIELQPAADGLARKGSRFWIERPQISLSRIRSLETVVGAKYVAVLPAPANAAPQYVFEGESHPLTIADAVAVDIEIAFQLGHGLVVGDPLRYRGIAVGEVTSVDLNETLTGVTVRVRLSASARPLAKNGSRFWVERPQLSFQGVRGLETLVGGRYVAVDPGPASADSAFAFVGLEQAPAGGMYSPDGLRFVLRGDERGGIDAGAPLRYRGVAVGSIVEVQLASDAAEVEFEAYVESDYRALVRENSVFWATSGFDFDLGISGVQVTAETLATIAAGGVSFATPNSDSPRVTPGHRFKLADEEPDWLEWQPRLPVGSMIPADPLELPRPGALTLRWKESGLTLRPHRQRAGLALLLEDGRLLGPPELMSAPSSAQPESTTASFAGVSFDVDEAQTGVFPQVAVKAVGRERWTAHRAWPLARLRRAGEPEDCWVVTDEQPLIPLLAGQLTKDENEWRVDAAFVVRPQWNGAAVVATRDASLVGCLRIASDPARTYVARIPETLIPD